MYDPERVSENQNVDQKAGKLDSLMQASPCVLGLIVGL